MVSCSSTVSARFDLRCRHNVVKHEQPDAANTVDGKHEQPDAADTVAEHEQPDAANTVDGSEHRQPDAANTVAEHRQPDAANTMAGIQAVQCRQHPGLNNLGNWK